MRSCPLQGQGQHWVFGVIGGQTLHKTRGLTVFTDRPTSGGGG